MNELEPTDRTRRARITRAIARRSGLLAGATLLAGCYVFPFAVPPARITAATGVAGGTLVARAEPPSGTAAAQRRYGPVFGGTVRGSIHPLDLQRNAHARVVDFGVGYMAEMYLPTDHSPFTYHGPYVELALQPWRLDPIHDHGPRFWMSLAGEMIITDLGYGGIYGAGGTLAMNLEVASFVHSIFGTYDSASNSRIPSFVFGSAEGEGGLGVQLATSVRVIGGEVSTITTLGLTMRIPAAVGVAGFVDPNGLRFAAQ